MDAATDYNRGRIGVGIMVRNSEGKVVFSLIDSLARPLSVMAAEARAILIGLKQAVELGHQCIAI